MSSETARDEAEIRALWDRASAAVCRGDWLAYRELWAQTDYVQIIHPDEPDWKIGWDAIGSA